MPPRTRRSAPARPSASRPCASPNLEKEQTVGEQAGGLRARGAGQGRRTRDAYRGRRCQRHGRRRRKPRRGQGRRSRRRPCWSSRPKPIESGESSQTRSRSGGAGSPEPRHGQGGPGRSRTGRSRATRQARSPRQGPESPRSSSMPKPKPRSVASKPRARPSAIFAKLEAEARGQYEILAKKGEGLQADRRRPAAVPKEAFQLLMLEHLDNLAEASRQGDLEHQVRQGRGLGKRRRERPHATPPTSCTAWPGRCRR